MHGLDYMLIVLQKEHDSDNQKEIGVKMPEDIKDSSLEESLQLLKDNPPVEPDKDELEDFQYESAKTSYDKAIVA